jgi:hypothetical protein
VEQAERMLHQMLDGPGRRVEAGRDPVIRGHAAVVDQRIICEGERSIGGEVCTGLHRDVRGRVVSDLRGGLERAGLVK